MSKFLLIASRDPYDGQDVNHYYVLAANLVKEGNQITVFLLQNGVFPARSSKYSPLLTQISKAGAAIYADDFSLRERGIAANQLIDGVEVASLEMVIDQLADGCKTLWH